MKKWNEKTTFEKAADIIFLIAMCFWLVFEVINRNNDVQWADIASRIAIIVACVFECISYWNEKRVLSYVAIGGIVCLLATFVIEFIILA